MGGKVVRIEDLYAARDAADRPPHYDKPKRPPQQAYAAMHELAHAQARFEMAAGLLRLGDSIAAALNDAAARLTADDDDLALADEYAIPSIDTRVAARTVAYSIVFAAAMHDGSRLLIPRFEAAADGAVGLHWKTPRIELLVSIPTDRELLVMYYGDNLTGDLFIKGTFRQDEAPAFLAEWLVRYELSG